MSWSRALLLLALAPMLVGCRGYAPDEPVVGDLELCCKAANEDNVSFVGCRATGYCRAGESVWVRGPITCTPEAADACEGGRCCALDLEAFATRGLEPPSAPASPAPTSPAPADEPVDEPAPGPAPITPMPLAGE